MSGDKPQFLSQKEVAHRWTMSTRTLEGWRDRGIGPRYYRFGNRVRYAVEDVESFERSCLEWGHDL